MVNQIGLEHLKYTWSWDSRKWIMVAGMMPLMPPPSMLRMVT